jgi:histidine triad (HIT) family protein
LKGSYGYLSNQKTAGSHPKDGLGKEERSGMGSKDGCIRLESTGSAKCMYYKTMPDSIFTKIIKGEIPSHKVYEDDLVLAFLDIHPVVPGHTLVIPKKQVEFVWDLPDEDYRAVMDAAKKVALHLREVLGTTYVGEQIVGIDVPHAHVQLIPFNTAAEYRKPQDMDAEPDHGALAKMAKVLAL